MSVKLLIALLLVGCVWGAYAADEVVWQPLHPSVLLNDNGPASCSGCHDTQFIRHNSSHGRSGWEPGCIACHLKGGRVEPDGREVRHLIQRPDIDNCKACHSVSENHFREPLKLPDRYTAFPGITSNTGVVYSPQAVSRSALNLENKSAWVQPWDVHAQRHLACNDCHFTANDPRHCSNVRTDLDHLIRDPRRLEATADYLRWPDHNLSTASCQCCHDPLKTHESFPYLVRHLEALECLSCHVPSLHAPAYQAIDETVLNPEGQPRVELRGVDPGFDPQKESVNALFVAKQEPVLLSRPLNPATADRLPIKSPHRIAPFNLVTHWYWQDGESGKAVPLEQVLAAYHRDGVYDPMVVERLDRNSDQRLDDSELWLDTAERVAFMAGRLKEVGVKDPIIRGDLIPYPVNHGTVEGEWSINGCTECHSVTGRLSRDVMLATRAPNGVELAWRSPLEVDANAQLVRDESGRWILKRESVLPRHYVFGFSRLGWIDQIGLLLLVMTGLGVLGHAALRIYHHRRLGVEGKAEVKEEYLYPLYERIWHWLMALGIVLLLLTGLEIHAPGRFDLIGFSTAVTIHNIIAFVVLINGGLSLLYHLFSGEIRQFFGFNRAFLREIRHQLFYYLRDIFLHRPHPIPKSRERKLNPLQQLTYLALLNLLLPMQILTGVLMWVKGRWPTLLRELGIQDLLAPVHYLGSWLLLIFLVVHLYLITTGHRPLSNLRAMVTGYDELDHQAEEESKHDA